MTRILPVLILNGRPAAGKSELIDYLRKLPVGERIDRFRIGEIEELDDFPILWERFEDDDLHGKNGRDRVYSDTTYTYEGRTHEGYVFKNRFFWDFLLQKLSFEYEKRIRRDPAYHSTRTTVIEFARGVQHGGWTQAYLQLSDAVLGRAVSICIDVPWEESLRRNRRRFNPHRPDSIPEHVIGPRAAFRPPRFPSGSTATKLAGPVALPAVNGICERFHETILEELYQVASRKKIYSTLEELQLDLDNWLDEFNHRRPHQGKRCDGKTPYATWIEGKEVADSKTLVA